MQRQARRLAILAGGGVLPREIAVSAAARGMPVSIVAIDGEADADFSGFTVTRVNWGQIGTMIRALKANGDADLVIVGRVTRPELKGIKPDLGFFLNIPAVIGIVASGGDDSVLRRVVRFFERHGLHIVGPGEAAPELVARQGPLGAVRAEGPAASDIERGLDIVRALGAYDIGQAVIVDNGRVLAIEGVEGTDRMIARVTQARAVGAAAVSSGVLVKRSKPGQDLRVDMPTIGPATVKGAVDARLTGVAVESGTVLIAERAQTLAHADAAGLFIEGVTDAQIRGHSEIRFDTEKAGMIFRPLGTLTPKAHATRDAVKGLATVDTLAPFGCGAAAVVVRNHVLAVEAGDEGAAMILARAAGLRPWASITRERRGVLAVRNAQDVTAPLIDSLVSAGYAGLAIGGGMAELSPALGEAMRAAEKRGVFVLVRDRMSEARHG